MRLSISLTVSLGLLLAVFSGSVVRGEDGPAEKALVDSIRDLIQAERLDDALVRLNSEKDCSSNTIAECYFALSQAHFGRRNWETTLKLLDTIIDKYPKSSVVAHAPLGKAEVYLRSGAEAKMVETLERIVAAPAVDTMLGVMDASNTHNRAYELLGAHFVQTRQWQKALDSYLQWRPTSWCGNCLASLQLRKNNALLLCYVHTENHRDAADAAWKTIVSGRSLDGSASWHLAALTLIRLYAEAGQRDDLNRILDEISPPVLPLGAVAAAAPPAAAKDRLAVVAEMRRAILSVQSTSGDVHIKTLFSKPIDRAGSKPSVIMRDVAAWLTVRDRPQQLTQFVAAARRGQGDTVLLAEILAAIDTPAARTALVSAAVKAGREHRDEVLAIIRAHCSKPDEVITRVAKTVKLSSADGVGPSHPDRGFFYAAWPKPEIGSLPRSLPAEVLDEKPR